MACSHRSGTAREWRQHCIPTSPCGTRGPNSKAWRARWQRSRLMRGTQPQSSYLHHRTCSPGACHQQSIPASLACSWDPRRTWGMPRDCPEQYWKIMKKYEQLPTKYLKISENLERKECEKEHVTHWRPWHPKCVIDYIHPEAGPLEPHQIGTIACLG